VRKAYGDNLLMDDVDFILPRGGIVGVIGPNGAGKTTLFRMIMGQEKPDAGELKVGDSVALSYVDQSREKLAGRAHGLGGDLGRRQGPRDGGQARGELARLLGPVRLPRPDQQKKVKDLSGGERNRLHLATLLKSGGNVLLLDEPTNDLDVDTLRALEEALVSFAGCAVVISHDRWFLDRIATHILAFEGDSQVVWFEGNYQDYEADRKRRLGVDADQPHRIKYRKLTRARRGESAFGSTSRLPEGRARERGPAEPERVPRVDGLSRGPPRQHREQLRELPGAAPSSVHPVRGESGSRSSRCEPARQQRPRRGLVPELEACRGRAQLGCCSASEQALDRSAGRPPCSDRDVAFADDEERVRPRDARELGDRLSTSGTCISTPQHRILPKLASGSSST
jgi:ABC-type multidrug transport system ATPase subunit